MMNRLDLKMPPGLLSCRRSLPFFNNSNKRKQDEAQRLLPAERTEAPPCPQQILPPAPLCSEHQSISSHTEDLEVANVFKRELQRRLEAEAEESAPPRSVTTETAQSAEKDEALARQLMREEEAAMKQLTDSINMDREASMAAETTTGDEALARQLMREETAFLEPWKQSAGVEPGMSHHLQEGLFEYPAARVHRSAVEKDEAFARRLQAELLGDVAEAKPSPMDDEMIRREIMLSKQDEALARRLQQEMMGPAASPRTATTTSPSPVDDALIRREMTSTSMHYGGDHSSEMVEEQWRIYQNIQQDQGTASFVARGQAQTADAIHAGQSRLIQCAGCSLRLRAPVHSPSVYCPQCGFVNTLANE